MTLKSPDITQQCAQRTAVMSGSFNPFTLGHLSILRRGLKLFDRVVVVIGYNINKPEEAGHAETRAKNLTELLAPLGNRVSVTLCSTLITEEAERQGACALLRGVRSASDLDYELRMADINRMLTGIETVMLPAEPALASVSSSMVRELEAFGHDASRFLPAPEDIHL